MHAGERICDSACGVGECTRQSVSDSTCMRAHVKVSVRVCECICGQRAWLSVHEGECM